MPIFALIDCNNFFASCEQVFRPDLAGKPIVVLSSNDGCVVARSAEARALGIPMGAPAFKYKKEFKEGGVIQFSANFELYGDLSRRITEILTSITPRLEIYSIDEAFLDLSELDIKDYTAWATNLRETIWRWIGIPVSIGIAPSKTLAKLASERAKRNPDFHGVGNALTDVARRDYLQATAIEDIWGVGRRLAPRLRSLGVATAYDLSRITPRQGRNIFASVYGERMVRELNGYSCIPLEKVHVDQKMISASRTFGKDTNDLGVVQAALASFVARTTQRLRTSDRLATKLSLFASTDKHKPRYRTFYHELKLPQPTADTGYLTSLVCTIFAQELYQKQYLYHRGGVVLSHFTDKNPALQADLFGSRNIHTFERSLSRMQAVDEVHSRHGKQSLMYATEKLGVIWQPKSTSRSPHYSTHWDDLPLIK
jgi:DNA polymerase V